MKLRQRLTTAGCVIVAVASLLSCDGDGMTPPHDVNPQWVQEYGEVLCDGICATPTGEVLAVGARWDVLARNEEWRRQDVHEFPQLRGVWGASSDSVFAVGRFGTVLCRNNGKWRPMPMATTDDLNDVCGESPGSAYAVGANGAAFHFDGAAWTKIGTDTTSTFRDACVADGTLFAIANLHEVRRYVQSAWDTLLVHSNGLLLGVWAASSSDVFAVGSSGTILRYDGQSWRTMISNTNQTLVAVSGTSFGNVFAVGSNGTFVHFDGVQWTSAVTPINYDLRSVWALPNNDAWIGGTGVVLRVNAGVPDVALTGTAYTVESLWSSQFGEYWAVDGSGNALQSTASGWERIVIPAGESFPLLAIRGRSGDDIIAGGVNGRVVRFDGVGWSLLPTETLRDVCGVWASAGGDIYAVGAAGLTMRFQQGWEEVPSESSVDLRDVTGTSDASPIAVGDDGTVLRFDGASFQELTAGTFPDLYAVCAASDATFFAAGASGTLLRIRDTQVQRLPSGTAHDLYGIWAASEKQIFAVGEGGEAIVWEGLTGHAIRPATPATLLAVWGRPGEEIVAAGVRGTIFRLPLTPLTLERR